MAVLPDHVYGVILAGGSGTRFWPKSRHLTPKQLCAIGSSDETMIEATLNRLDDFIPPSRRLIVTHSDQMTETKKIVGDRCKYFLAEPEARNTANALALAALDIKALHRGSEEPIMISLHADALIQKEDLFRNTLRDALDVAERGYLTLLGVVPTYAETGYGYIERGLELPSATNAFAVKSFREKPDYSLAQEYVASRSFYWNSGIFIWRVSVLLAELAKNLPSTIHKLADLVTDEGFQSVARDKLSKIYAELPKIAIDHAVLEVSHNVAVVEADVGWQDVGSWDALSQCFPVDDEGNLKYGKIVAIDTHDSTIDSDGPLIACLGVRDLVVVHSKGAILVCPKHRSQDVKLIVEKLKLLGEDAYT